MDVIEVVEVSDVHGISILQDCYTYYHSINKTT